MSHDLCCHYFHSDFAEQVFPVYFHGSGKSMWYAQFIGHILYPKKCLVSNNIYMKNTEHLPHSDITKNSYNDPTSITRKFSNIIKNENHRQEFNKWNDFKYILEKNKQIYSNVDIDNSSVIFTKEILDSIITK